MYLSLEALPVRDRIYSAPTLGHEPHQRLPGSLRGVGNLRCGVRCLHGASLRFVGLGRRHDTADGSAPSTFARPPYTLSAARASPSRSVAISAHFTVSVRSTPKLLRI